MKLLHIDSSILGDNSVSRAISRAVVDRIAAEQPGIEIVRHDLAADPIGHLTARYLAGQSDEVRHDQALQEDLAIGGRALDEFLAADTVVIGVAFYNFAIASQLKAWVDRILIAGKTFRYADGKPEGLAGGKRVILAIARGGSYPAETPMAAFEHAESYLRAVFAFVGIGEVEVIAADGIAHGPEARERSLANALERVRGLAV